MAKKITIDNLATMIGKGFQSIDKRFDEVTKEMRDGFDRIENILLKQHADKIEKLERRMAELESALAIK